MSGIFTNGLPTASLPLTGSELIAADTGLAQGLNPESEAISVSQISVYASNSVGKFALGTADNGSTQTLTAAMISASNAEMVAHVTTGGTTPSLTLPLATALIAALPNAGVGSAYLLRVINSNSGTATVVTNTGWTTSGTLTLATNTTRDFIVAITAATTCSITSIGTGANS